MKIHLSPKQKKASSTLASCTKQLVRTALSPNYAALKSSVAKCSRRDELVMEQKKKKVIQLGGTAGERECEEEQTEHMAPPRSWLRPPHDTTRPHGNITTSAEDHMSSWRPVTSIVAVGPVLVFRRKLSNSGWSAESRRFFFGAADHKTWKHHAHVAREQSNGLEPLMAKNGWCLLSIGRSGFGK